MAYLDLNGLTRFKSKLDTEVEGKISTAVADKQDILTAGTGITITNNVISASADVSSLFSFDSETGVLTVTIPSA